MMKALGLTLLLIIYLCGPAAAEFYKYTDREGNIRFTDDLTKVPEAQRPNVKSYDEAVTPSPPPEPGKEETSDDNKTATDAGLDTQGKKLKEKQVAMEKKFKSLMKEKKQLEAASKETKSVEETLELNKKIKKLNQDISEFDQKQKNLTAEIDAYNAKVSEEKNSEKK